MVRYAQTQTQTHISRRQNQNGNETNNRQPKSNTTRTKTNERINKPNSNSVRVHSPQHLRGLRDERERVAHIVSQDLGARPVKIHAAFDLFVRLLHVPVSITCQTTCIVFPRAEKRKNGHSSDAMTRLCTYLSRTSPCNGWHQQNMEMCWSPLRFDPPSNWSLLCTFVLKNCTFEIVFKTPTVVV